MKLTHSLLSVSMLLTFSLASSYTFAAEEPGPQDSPSVEIRQLEQVDPNRFRSPKPIEFVVPEVEPMKALPDAELNVASYEISGNTVIADDVLLAMLENYKGTITFQELFNAVTEITGYYRDQGYMVARAYVPEQEVSDAKIQIVILEGVLGDVVVSGDEVIRNDLIAKNFEEQVRTGVINAEDMERGALLINDLPGSSASVILRPGSETGMTDTEVNVTDEGRYDFSLDLNNFGTPVTGEYRLGGQVGVNNLFKAGDRFTFRPMVSDTGDTLYGSLGFAMPVWKPGMKVGIRFSHLQSLLGEEFEDLDIENTATTIALDGTYAFVRSRNKNIFGSFTYEMRTFERVCGFCQDQFDDKFIEDAEYDLDAVQLGAAGDYRDEYWGGGINTWYAYARKGLTDVDQVDAGLVPETEVNPDDVNEVVGVDRIEGKFTAFRIGGQRLQRINDLWTASVKLDVQHSGDDLDPAERIGLGGINGVRAYRPSEALGDKGVVLQTEIRYSAVTVAERWDWMSSFQPYFLIDAGASELNNDGGNLTRDLSMQRTGTGLGLRIQDQNRYHVDLVVATRISDRDSLVDQPDDDETNFWLQAVYWF
jgi:hemolysin activation/secretion protein